jgi:nitrous oxide reductase
LRNFQDRQKLPVVWEMSNKIERRDFLGTVALVAAAAAGCSTEPSRLVAADSVS